MQPIQRITHQASRITSLPILMYHSISDDPEPGVRSYYRVCTSPPVFREQMQWLKDNGYRGVTLSAGLAALGGAGRKQKAESGNQKSEADKGQLKIGNIKPVVLTFDDGFRDFYTNAVPALQHHGFSATMYLATAFIGSKSEIGNRKSEILLSPSERHSSPVTRHAFHGKECLTWNEIQELNREGIEFGSHTVHHPELVNLSWPEIQSEIANSKAQIENHLGTAVKAFAYPYAFPQARRDFVNRFKDLLATSGYETCVTTQIGRHHPGADPLEIKRLPVNSDDDDQLLRAKLTGSYDWLALPQTMMKEIKQRFPGSRKVNCAPAPHPRSSESALNS